MTRRYGLYGVDAVAGDAGPFQHDARGVVGVTADANRTNDVRVVVEAQRLVDERLAGAGGRQVHEHASARRAVRRGGTPRRRDR